MFKWLHHLLEPHCPDCAIEHQCETCDILKLLLEQERAEKTRLLHMLTQSTQPTIQDESIDLSKLNRSPKSIMRQLERESAREAAIIRNRETNEKIEQIEKELTGN